MPTPLFTDGWKLTASHNADAAIGALTPDRRGTPARRNRPGMWFQVELPKPEMITEIQFQSPPPGGRGGRGECRRRLRERSAGCGTGRLPARLQGGGFAGRVGMDAGV